MAAFAVFLFSMLVGLPVFGQSTVATLGGGPNDNNSNSNGNRDGATLQSAQFDTPGGMSLDVTGALLFVADTRNSSVRLVNLTNDTTSTFVSGLLTPVDVTVDSQTNVYVLTQGDGLIRRYDVFGNLGATVNAATLTLPTAMAFDLNGDLFVVELGGALKKVTVASGAVTTVVAAGTFSSPRGVAVLEAGAVAVSDTGNHAVRLVDPNTFAVTLLAGILGTAGGNDGAQGVGSLNTPYHLVQGGGDNLVVADWGNHAVRKIDGNGQLVRIYGVDSSSWASDFPGWEDGNSAVAESRRPAGLAVDGAGDVFVSEQFYHLIRKATGTGLSGPSGGGSSGTTTVNPPSLSISPNTGYYPLGQTVTVTSSSTNVYYRTDGTAATTNDVLISMTNGVGTIKWKNSTNDLTALRVSSFVFSGTNEASTNVSGLVASTNRIGVPAGLNTNLVGGIGSTIVVPIVVDLPADVRLRTLGFRLEVAGNGGAPIIGDTFNALAVTTNDFIPIVTSDGGVEGAARFTATPYSFGTTRGLSVNFIGTNANLSVSSFAVVALVSIPIPGSASIGDTYSIDVILPTGTSDTGGGDVILNPAPARTLTVANISYLVGDSSPAGWYNAGDFGNTPDGTGAGQLLLSDVNSAFNASVGIRPPYPFTDVFNTMDVFPEDAAGTVGGDGQIRFLDWQIILLRQQHLNTNPVFGVSQTNWVRTWSAGGILSTGTTNLNASRSVSGLPAAEPGRVWERQVLLVSGSSENVAPSGVVSVPVYARLAANATVSGMQFRAVARPSVGAPPLTTQLQFISALPNERQASSAITDIAVAWNIGDLNLAAGSSNLVGNILLTIPAAAAAGHCYLIDIETADGSPDFSTQYEFEIRAGCVWVASTALSLPSLISDDWRQAFFNGVNSLTADWEDADNDGFANILEYLAGTNPTNANSLLRLDRVANAADSVFELLSAPGKSYVLECREQLDSSTWHPISTNLGNGQAMQFLLTNGVSGTRYYRLRVDP